MSALNSTVEYREVSGFPGYRVGSDGSVWSQWAKITLGWRYGTKPILGKTWKRLRPGSHRTGHLMVMLCPGRHTKFVHRLVLEAFIGPCPEGMEACHNDGNCKNNCATNLRWDTSKANAADKIRHGVIPRGEAHKRARLTDEGVRIIRAEIRAGMSHREIAKKLGVGKSTVTRVANNLIWRHIH